MAAKKKCTGGASGRAFKAGPGGLDLEGFARWYRDQSIAHWRRLDLKALGRIARELEKVRAAGRQVFIMGNGGSAAIASQLATDLSKTASTGKQRLLRCISLTDNVPYLTAIGNDIGYEAVFVRQMENLLRRGDLVLLISGSGNSPNVVKAARYAKENGARTAALLGFDGGKLRSLADVPLVVPCDQYGVIEDLHQAAGHILTFYLRQSK